jgi:hypothetical protein
MKNIFPHIAAWLHNDRKLLYLTAAIVLVGGLFRAFNLFEISVWLLNGAFIPYFVMRFGYYLAARKRRWSFSEKRRFVFLALIFIIVVLNFFTPFRIEFLLLLLLLLDYLFLN